MTPDAERVLRLLTMNRSIYQADIASACDLPIRTVQECIQSLRIAGHPIGSDRDGVWLAQTADEARACSEALKRRIAHQYLTYRALRNTARRMRVAEDAAARATLWDFLEGEAS